MTCPECGGGKPICPDHRGMCTECCGATKSYFRQFRRLDVVKEMKCDCEED